MCDVISSTLDGLCQQHRNVKSVNEQICILNWSKGARIA